MQSRVIPNLHAEVHSSNLSKDKDDSGLMIVTWQVVEQLCL